MTPERESRIANTIASRQLNLCVILENVHDPHNIGAVLRSCDSVGIQEVYLLVTDPRMDIESIFLSKRASSGARKWLDIYLYTDLEKCISDVKAKYDAILGTKLNDESKSLYEFDLSGSLAIAFGNEHNGLTDAFVDHLDGNIEIPQFGMVKSLNISVACAVTLFESLRQRSKKGMYTPEMNDVKRKIQAKYHTIQEQKIDSDFPVKVIS